MINILYITDANISFNVNDIFEDSIVTTYNITKSVESTYYKLKELISSNKFDIIIGIGIGGFYASLFKGQIKFIINPILQPSSIDTQYTELENKFYDIWLDEQTIYETYAIFTNERKDRNNVNIFINNFEADNLINIQSYAKITNTIFETYNNI